MSRAKAAAHADTRATAAQTAAGTPAADTPASDTGARDTGARDTGAAGTQAAGTPGPQEPTARGAAGPPVLRLTEAVKRFGATVAAGGISVDVAPRELLAVVGPSGCGKSTLLRLIAGLIPPDAGSISIAGKEVAGPAAWVPAERRGVGVVFQDHALFPHLSVAGNIAFGLARRGPHRRSRVDEVVELAGLAHLTGRYPHELSGGEAQRVALARALAPRPALVLLDEPFSNLDRNLRARIRADTLAVLDAAGAAGVFVTHDQEEALAVGDRVAVMREGRFHQVDSPDIVFHAPASRFVGTFLGEADFLAARQVGGTATTRLGAVPATGEPDQPRDVEVMVRPHEVEFTVDPNGDAVVARAEFRGGFIAYQLDLGEGEAVRSLRPHTEAVTPGTRVRVRLDPGHSLAAFPADGSTPPPDARRHPSSR